MAVKTTYWAQMQKSDDFVKKALKLDGLAEGAVKASPKYKDYQKYVYKAEGVKMDNWALDEVNPTTIWNRLGLGGMSAAQREKSPALKNYVRYANKYDSKVCNRGYEAYIPSTDAEMDILLRVWARADRSESYVLKRLGIYTDKDRYYSYVYHKMMTRFPTEVEIRSHANSSKFQQFMPYSPRHFSVRRGEFSSDLFVL
ncbi:hypothetical protein PRIC2_009396 [Phytophthora ramorum]